MDLRIKQWRSIAVAVPLGLAAVSLHAETTTMPWDIQANDYQGFYVYGQIGQATADTSRGEVEDGLQAIDSSIESVWIEESGVAWSAGGGYFFNNWLSAELGWIDLGSRDVKLAEGSTYPATGYDYYPQSGSGPSLGVIGHIPLGADFFIAPKLGLFVWNDDGETDNNGTDYWYGAELNYRLDQKLSIFAGWQRFDLPRQDVDMLSIGVRYLFVKPSAQPVLQPVAVVKEGVDSDGDGVVDSIDRCPETAKIYQVDSAGCTLFKEERIEHRLVINYANDSADIGSQYDAKIEEMFQFMTQNNIKNIYVEGHTSAAGSESYNQALSLQRAKSLVDALSNKYGLNKEIFIPIGKGESQLLDSSATAEADAANRRTEIVVGKQIKKEVMR